MEAKKMAAQHAEKRAENAHRERKETGAKKALRSGKYHSGRHEPTHRPHPQHGGRCASASPPQRLPLQPPLFLKACKPRPRPHPKKRGATDAAAEASEGCGLSVSVRKGELENVERNRDKSLGVTVYMAHRRGQASTSDFSTRAIEQTVQAAYDIARFPAEAPMAGLPDEADIAPPASHRDLALFHPWPITSEEAARLALECEAAALQTSRRISN